MRDVGGDADLGAESEIDSCAGVGDDGVGHRVLGLVGGSDVFFLRGVVVAGGFVAGVWEGVVFCACESVADLLRAGFVCFVFGGGLESGVAVRNAAR